MLPEHRNPQADTLSTVVMRTPIALLLALGVSRTATAGGQLDGDPAAQRAANRTVSTWRKQGTAGLRRAVHAMCEGDSYELREAASELVLRWGTAAMPLLVRVSGDCPQAQSMAANVLCTAGRSTVLRDGERVVIDENDDPRVVGRARRATERALRPVLAQLTHGSAGDALSLINEVTDDGWHEAGCPNQELVFTATAAPIAGLLRHQHPLLTRETLELLAKLGPVASPAVADVTSLIDNPEFRASALRVLAAIGPASAPAVPKLTALIAGPEAAAAASVLGQIGFGARSALPDLVLTLNRAMRNKDCISLSGLAIPIGKIASGSDLDAPIALTTLLPALGTCPRDEEYVVKALAELGRFAARGNAAIPVLLTMVRDPKRSLDQRLLVASAVSRLRAQLVPGDLALIVALNTKRRILDSVPDGSNAAPQVAPHGAPPPTKAEIRARSAIDGADKQLTACRKEASLVAIDSPFVSYSAPAADVPKLEQLAACLGNTLCGPSAGERSAAMTKCCQAGFGTQRPSWCAP